MHGVNIIDIDACVGGMTSSCKELGPGALLPGFV